MLPSPPPVKPARPEKGEKAAPPSIERDAALVELRLAIGKDGLGIELGRDARLGCLEVTELVVSLPGVRFPLDVSGGVSRFRHRRGELRRLAVELHARGLEKWAAPKLRGLVSAGSPDVWIAARRGAATIGLASKESAAVLAFDVTLDLQDGDVRFSIVNARGSGLSAPATELAIGALRGALGKWTTREGARFTAERAIERIARAVLPEAGARAPEAEGVRWSVAAAFDDRWILHASFGATAADTGEEAARARESNALTRDADDARAAGDRERARALDVQSLEHAPRHPEIAARIAEIDQATGGRAEAALATLAEADRDSRSAAHVGPLVAELLAEIGDTSAAIAAFARVGEVEVVPALAARAYERAAELASDPWDALVWLDQAVARAPAVARVRWARVARRLAAGRTEDALADVQHLEAMTSGAKAKHAVWRRAGEAWRAAGLANEAATLFERALRYVPEDPEALAGLGAALVAEGKGARGVSLLARAVEMAEAHAAEARDEAKAAAAQRIVHAMTLDLARALAEATRDRPAAVARARAIPNTAEEALDARALEGRWRAAMGDLAGASLAFARLRDLAASRVEGSRAGGPPDRALGTLVGYLREAAAFEQAARGDRLAAQRHLACALRLRPSDPEVDREYRAVCAALAPPLPVAPPAPPLPPPAPAPATWLTPDPPKAIARAAEAAPELDEAHASARVDELTRTLQNDPSRDDVVDELTTLLMRLGRGLELLALLSARLEEATPERRVQLIPPQRAVLERLEAEARAAGREMEASLFRDARAMLD